MPGETYKCGPDNRAIKLDETTERKIVGPDSILKRRAWGGLSGDAIAHQIGKSLTNKDIAAHLDGGLCVYLGNLRGHRVEDGCGAVVFVVDGKYLGNDGEVAVCSGSIRVQFTQRTDVELFEAIEEKDERKEYRSGDRVE